MGMTWGDMEFALMMGVFGLINFCAGCLFGLWWEQRKSIYCPKCHAYTCSYECDCNCHSHEDDM